MSKSFRTGISVSGSSIFSGSLTASFANISGSITTASITSTSGSIGGWVLSSNGITAGSSGSTVGLISIPDSSSTIFYAGGSTASSAPFRITNSGNINASAGTHTLGSTTFYDANGINFTGTGTNEGGQVNFKAGSSYTGQDWYFDNYQGTLRLVDYGANTRIHVSGSTSISAINLVGVLTTTTAVSNGLNPGLTVASSDNTTANWNAITISRNGVQLGSIRSSSAAGAPTLVSGSDYRLKKEIQDSQIDFVNVIKNLRPVNYEWKDSLMGIGKMNGFIAHEVQSYIPEAVDGEKDAVDKDGNVIPQMLTQQPFTFYLVGALKEALFKIDELQSRLDNAGL